MRNLFFGIVCMSTLLLCQGKNEDDGDLEDWPIFSRIAIFSESIGVDKIGCGNQNCQVDGEVLESEKSNSESTHDTLSHVEENHDEVISRVAALHEQGNVSHAISILRSLRQREPDSFKALDLLATMLSQVGQERESAELFEEALRRRPLSATTRYNYGITLEGLGRVAAAQEEFRRAAALDPTQAIFANAACLAQKLDPREGFDCFRAAVRRFPSRADLRNNLGSVLMSLGREDLAAKQLRKAVTLQPVYPEAWRNLGGCLRALDDRPAALQAFRKAVEQRPRYAQAWVNLAELLAELGQAGEIEAELSAAVRAGLWKLPLQRPTHFVPYLAARPWYDAKAFPWYDGLVGAAAAIRREAEALASDAGFRYRTYQSRIIDKRRRSDGWKDFWFWENGRRIDNHCREAPTTCKVLQDVVGPDATGMPKGNIYFSMLEPGTTLTAHCGPTNTRIRVHLGLVCPPGARLSVGLEERRWKEYEVLAFDDSFQHEVVHNGRQRRLVLIFDVWHPDLATPQQRAAALGVPELP